MRKNLGPGVDGWAISLKAMMSIVVVLGLVITGIYWGVNKFVIDNSSVPVVERKKKVGPGRFSSSCVYGSLLNGSANITFQDKPKLSMGESMKVLLSSRYVRDLATLVVAYGISINLVEVTWKSKLKAQVC
jgi:ATP:ADP antiporter, AAA family